MQTFSQSRKHADYTVGWICALKVELTAARAMLDKIHEELLSRKSGDDNLYTLGSIGPHNVVIVCLPAGMMGTNSAATVTKDLRRSFEAIKFSVMVGIGGGIPTNVDIRLGDVAVSTPDGQHGGVVQYDFGKTVGNGHHVRVGTLNKPPPLLLGAVSALAARGDPQLHKHITKMVESRSELNSYAVYPGEQYDQLFDADYTHESQSKTCDQCDRRKVKSRPPRTMQSPVIHYGNIASGNQVMRDAKTRDRLATQENVICFEMEAAGFMDSFPCLVVRGICDYADSHKNKKWQPYAAVVAAAYTKELLLVLPPEEARPTHVVSEAGHDTYKIPFSLRGLPIVNKFVPRDDEMSRLENVLVPAPDHDMRRKVFVLHGLGGIGKTQLALEFARRHQKVFNAIFWLDGSSRNAMQQSIAGISSKLPVKQISKGAKNLNQAAELDAVIDEILRWFSLPTNSQWLMVIDNVDRAYPSAGHDPEAFDVEGFFPDADHGSILITSRLKELEQLGSSHKVDSMNETQGTRLLEYRMGRAPEGALS